MKRYLGDSVYAEIENGMIKLTTDNGFGPSNEIYLEEEVINSLILFIERQFNVKFTIEKLVQAEVDE